MRPFNLDLWKAGEPVITRDGRTVEQLTYFDSRKDSVNVLYGTVNGKIGSWDLKGLAFQDVKTNVDLFHPEPEMWVNVYQNHNLRCTGVIIDSKEEAEEIQASGNYPDYIGTYKLVKE
jgi:hypothetical protein